MLAGKVPGFDFSGVVERCGRGRGCEAFAPGDAVFGILPPLTGSFAEVVVCPADQVSDTVSTHGASIEGMNPPARSGNTNLAWDEPLLSPETT